MRFSKTILALSSFLAIQASLPQANAISAKAAELDALTSVFGLPITNSMVTSWVVSIVLIIAVRLAIRKPKMIPTRGQAIVESLVEGVFNLIEPITGKQAARPAFPLLVGLFTFILIHNWSGLFPGVGTIGWGHATEHGFHINQALVRPGNADLNGTAALAIVAMIGWIYIVLKYAGLKVLLLDLFGNKADKKEIPGPIYIFLFFIFGAVGVIEVISIIFRPISLSFRLFGNVFGGENLLHAMTGLYKWGLPIPFYFLEILIGFVQALVFTLLVSVYIGLICNHGEEEH